jgi:hypothetical protein
MGSDPFKESIEELPVIPLILMFLNLSFFLIAVIFPTSIPYAICVAFPVIFLYFSTYSVTSAVFYTVLISIIIIFLLGIILTLLSRFKQGAVVFLISGLLTFPLGVLGIIASFMVWEHSVVARCLICNGPLRVNQARPGYFFCTKCHASYAYMGRSTKL